MEIIEFQNKGNGKEKGVGKERKYEINTMICEKKKNLEKKLEKTRVVNILGKRKIESQIKALDSLYQSIVFNSKINEDSLETISKDNEFAEIYISIKETFFEKTNNPKMEEGSIPAQEDITESPETNEQEDEDKKEEEGVKEENKIKENKKGKEKDELLDKAREIVLETKNTSFSNLQLKLKIGINRAKRIFDQLEKEGIVGPSDNGVGPREFLGDKKEAIQDVLNREPDEIDKELEEEMKNKGEEEKIKKGETYELEIDGDGIKKLEEENNEIDENEEEKENTNPEIDPATNTKEKSSKKINWGKLNPLSWFKKEKGLINDNSWLEKELLDENNNEKENKNDDIEKVLDEKIAQAKNEKKKTLYTKEQQKEFFDGLKEKLKNGEITEADFKDAIFKRTEEIHNFEKSGFIKAMDKWDNWGKEGGVGRYAKMAINIAMIAGVSTFAWNGFTGMTERIVSRTITGTTIGTGLGGIMTLLNKLPPEKKPIIQKIIKGTLIGGSVVFAISNGGVLPGLAIGVSSAVGYGASKYFEKKVGKIEVSDYCNDIYIPIDLENLDENISAIESEMKSSLKILERDKIIFKAIKNSLAILTSTIILGASDISHIMQENFDSNNEQISENNQNDPTEEKLEANNPSNENDPAVNKESDDTNTNTDNIAKTGSNENVENSEKSYYGEKEIGATADNGQGAISSIKELQKNLSENYKDIPADKIPENVKHIIDSDPNKLAQEYGMYRPGEEAESAKMLSGDKLIFDQETSEVKLHQIKTGEDIVLGKDKTYEGEMFDSNKDLIKDIVQEENATKVTEQTLVTEEDYIRNENDSVDENVTTGLSPEDQEYIKIDEVSDNQKLIDNEIKNTKAYAESYGINTDRNQNETDNDYLDRMKNEINEEKANLKNELISNEKMTLDKTLEVVHGEKVEIERLKDLKNLTRGYDAAIGQPSLKEIMEKIEAYDLKAVVTKDIGETPIDAQISASEKMHLIEKSLDGQVGYNYEFIQRLPSGDVEVLHIKLFKS